MDEGRKGAQERAEGRKDGWNARVTTAQRTRQRRGQLGFWDPLFIFEAVYILSVRSRNPCIVSGLID